MLRQRKAKAENTVENEDESRENVCFAAFQEEANGLWYLDSGASFHMTGQKKLLENCERMKG